MERTTVSETQRARHLTVAELVIERGSVSMDELADLTGVSLMTMYRDVSALEEVGLLQRHRGRVSAVASGLQEASAAFRVEQDQASKQAIARAIAARIPVGSSVLLDDSTSGVYVVRELRHRAPITIVTNSLMIARETTEFPALNLFLTGGSYQPWADAVLGPTTISTLAGMDADFCVLSASGIAQGRCFHPYEDVVAVKQAMMASADTSLLALDHSKLRRKALHAFADLKDLDAVVVDPDTTAADIRQLRDWGAALEVADPV